MARLLAPINVMDVLPVERSALLDLVAALAPRDWAASTACEGWTVHDVAVHLLGNDLGLLARSRDHFLPTSAEPPAEDWSTRVKALDVYNQTWVEAGRRLSPRLLHELLRITGDETIRFYASQDPLAPGEPLSWAGLDPAPMWLNIASEFAERWIHQQHIRDAVHRPGLTDRNFVHKVLSTYMHSLPPAFAPVRAPEGTTAVILVTGPARGQWSIRSTGRSWDLFEGASGDPDALVTVDQETAWRFLSGNLSVDAAKPAIVATGDGELVAHFFKAVAAVVERA